MSGELICGDCIEVLHTQPDKSVDLIIGSPPYVYKAKRYVGGKGHKMHLLDWVDWMADVTLASLRVSRNIVVWVANGCVKDGIYRPACEGLVYLMYQHGVICERPVIWHKNAPPNRKDWFGNDWEYCLAFRPPDSTRHFDWEAIAQPPKYKNGGHFRQRDANGNRRRGGDYPKSKLARPRDVLRVLVGGGHMGSKRAHDSEAPFPEGIVEPFIKTCVPKGGVVLDPFAGSGTTLAVAQRLGVSYIGIDNRQSQIDITTKRLQEQADAQASPAKA